MHFLDQNIGLGAKLLHLYKNTLLRLTILFDFCKRFASSKFSDSIASAPSSHAYVVIS